MLSIETKLIAGAVLLVAVALGALWEHRTAYNEGKSAGKAEVTVAWDKDRAAIQATADAALAQAVSERDLAIQTNVKVINDYEAKLSATSASTRELAQRLRLALGANAAGRGAVPQAPDKPGADEAQGGRTAGDVSTITERFADFTGLCLDTAAQLTALQNELRPQL